MSIFLCKTSNLCMRLVPAVAQPPLESARPDAAGRGRAGEMQYRSRTSPQVAIGIPPASLPLGCVHSAICGVRQHLHAASEEGRAERRR